MTKYYKIPFLSRVAGWVAAMLPSRVRAWIWIRAYQDLDHSYREVDDHHGELYGARSLYNAVSEAQVENLMRRIWRDYLKATTHERERSDHG